MHTEDTHVSHRLRASGMAGAIEGGGIAAEQVAGHQHLDGALFPVARRFYTFDRTFFDDMEVFGGVAFMEDEIILAIVGFWSSWRTR